MARRADAIAEQRAPLSKERVLRTAITLADEGGIGSLTMRKLAQALGVEAMSLYYYVANKDDLIAGITNMVMSEIQLPTAGSDWKAAIRRSAISFHNVLARHPWATSPMSPRTFGPAQLRYMEALLGRLRRSGFSAKMTHHAYHALDSHIWGSTLWVARYMAVKEEAADLGRTLLRQLPVDEYPYFIEHAEQHLTKSMRGEKSEFEFGLDLILDGLERLRGHGLTPSARSARRPRRSRTSATRDIATAARRGGTPDRR